MVAVKTKAAGLDLRDTRIMPELIEDNARLPMKTGKKKLIETIEAKIDELGIWLPSHELEMGVGKYIDRLNRKAVF